MSEKSFSEMTACEILADLKSAKHDYLMGRRPRRVRYRSDSGAEREVDNQAFNVSEINKAITQYEGLCAIEQGDTSGGRRCFLGGL